MINKQKIVTKSFIPQKKNIETPNKKVSKPKGIPSPNKLLKYNYKNSVDKMQERSLKSRCSFKKIAEQPEICQQRAQQIYQQQFNQKIKSHHIRQFFLQSKNTCNFQNSQPIFLDKKHSWRHRSMSLCKSVTKNSQEDRSASLIKFQRKQSETTTARKEKNKINPYTKSQYLYVRNQGKDAQIRRKIANQNRINFGLSLERSCKIISFELINPLQKYDKSEKAHRTDSTLPEFFIQDQEYNEQQRPLKSKVQSKQVPISYRKKSAYYKNLIHAQGSFPSNNLKNSHIQVVFNDFEPTPWQSSVMNCDFFYLRAQQM